MRQLVAPLFLSDSDFNPRTPCGVRQAHFNHMEEGIEFQSTHPVWGATIPLLYSSQWYAISIHAPRVGCDAAISPLAGVITDFNPRTPCGVRQNRYENNRSAEHI